MSNSTLRVILTLPWVLALGTGIYATICYFDRLDQYRLAGIAIFGLTLFALGIMGVTGQVASETNEETPAWQVIRLYLTSMGRLVGIILAFLAGIWLLLMAVVEVFSSFLPDWAVGLIFIIAFTWYIAGVIKVFGWLYDRGIWS
jgi:hypothetical protein